MVKYILMMLALAAPLRAETRPRIADESNWTALTERAKIRPTRVERLVVGATEYQVFVVVLATEAVEGQCPAEMSPRVSFYLARPKTGTGGEVYPARLTVQCVSDDLTRQEAAVDAGFDGAIRDWTLYDPAANKFLTMDKAKLTPRQKARLDALLAGAVAKLTAI